MGQYILGLSILNLPLLIFWATRVGIQTYESHATLQSYTSPYECVLYAMYMG